MTYDQRLFDTWTPRALRVMRLVVGFLFLQHGTAKLLYVPRIAEHNPLLGYVGA